MIRTLFVSTGELNKGARRPKDVPPTAIRTVGVVGAGFMGAGIAYVAALAGLDVVLVDRDAETAETGKARSHKLMTDQIMKGRAKTADRDALLARIRPSASYADLAACDLVIEAVFEDPAVKAEAIRQVEGAIGPDCHPRLQHLDPADLGPREGFARAPTASSASTSSRRSSG